MSRSILLSFLVLTMAIPLPARAQAARAAGTAQASRAPMMASVDEAFFRGLSYRLVGPSRGGRVTTVTGVPSQPRTTSEQRLPSRLPTKIFSWPTTR